jgi:hypothetical protein
VNIASVTQRLAFAQLKVLTYWENYTHITMNVRGDGRCVVRKEGAVLGINNEVVKILCKPKLRALAQLQVLPVLNVSHLWGGTVKSPTSMRVY